MGGEFGTGAAGVAAAHLAILALDGQLDGLKLTKEERNAILQMIGTSVAGVVGTAVAGGDASQGFAAGATASMSDAYNRQLHPDEKKFIKEKANELADKYGTPQLNGGANWADILELVARANVNGEDAQALNAYLQKGTFGPMDAQRLTFVLGIAQEVIQQEASKNQMLTWKDGSAIIAYGDKVYAFQATEKQYNDSSLFASLLNPLSNNASLLQQYGSGSQILKFKDPNGIFNDPRSVYSTDVIGNLKARGTGVDGAESVAPELYFIGTGSLFKGGITKIIEAFGAKTAVKTEVAAGAGIVAENAVTQGEQAAGKNFTKAEVEKLGYKPCCFAAGTMVATPQGERAIETLKIGDVVWSKPEDGGDPFIATISATHIRDDQAIYRLSLKKVNADGTSTQDALLVTPGHPFYVPARKGFVPLIELQVGDRLQSLGDGAGNEASIDITKIELVQVQGITYNLTVEIGHTFYVGKLDAWVHNVGPCYDCLSGVCSIHTTDHIVVLSGKAPNTSTPNSVYEVSRADGTKSITYYDDQGRMFSREDYGQLRTHGTLGYDANGKVPPHEHKITYNDRGYVDGKYYREMDKDGNPVGPWIPER